jgi:hypothetical protein
MASKGKHTDASIAPMRWPEIIGIAIVAVFAGLVLYNVYFRGGR